MNRPMAKSLMAASVLAFAGLSTPAKADRALIVGIDTYQDASLTFPLAGASKSDSERIHKLLTGAMGYREDDIKILRDADATRAAILENRDLAGASKAGERVFFVRCRPRAFRQGLRTETKATVSMRPWCRSMPPLIAAARPLPSRTWCSTTSSPRPSTG